MNAVEQLDYWESVIGAMDDRLAAIKRERALLDHEEIEVLERRDEAYREQRQIIQGEGLDGDPNV